MKLTSQQQMALMALRDIALFLVFCFVVIWLALQSGCSRQAANNTPIVSAPRTRIEVLNDAQALITANPALDYALTADTKSMEPFFTSKSVPLFVTFTGQAVPNGTVAIYNRDPAHQNVLHVITQQNETAFYFSGYNNHDADGWFPKGVVKGIVVGQLYLP